MTLDVLQMVLITIIAAATPLMIAALGELVAERSGVLNLGVEGMMVLGAATGFAVAGGDRLDPDGAVAGAGAGLALSALFGILTVVLAANQVASGLAMTILGLGLSGLVRGVLCGLKREPAPHLHVPGLTELPGIGRLVFGQDGFVYFGFGLVAAVGWFLCAPARARAAGHRRRPHRHPRARPEGAQGALPRRAVRGRPAPGSPGPTCRSPTPRSGRPRWTAGRGWIALALVVFASWRPLRVLAGAMLFGGATVSQLHAQAAGIGLPGQALSALPYLATILALVLLSLGRRQGGSLAPAALGRVFTRTARRSSNLRISQRCGFSRVSCSPSSRSG